MVGMATVHTIHDDYRKQKTYLVLHIIYTLYSAGVDPYPGKKAKLFEYAKGLSPDVAVS